MASDTPSTTYRRIDGPSASGIMFSVCTLVNKPDLYQLLLQSFAKGGFDEANSEFLMIDNAEGNAFDAFSGLNLLISEAKGRYVILCHQDIHLIDAGFDELVARLDELERRDPRWALAGNAGRTADGRPLLCISDRFGANQRAGTLPARSVSLDENFIVLRRSANLAPSIDLNGWHLYGADLCIQARLRGFTSYVIDFHLRHESGVLRIDRSYFKVLETLEDKYYRLFKTQSVYTTCLTPVLTASPLARMLARLKRLRKKLRSEARDRTKRPGA